MTQPKTAARAEDAELHFERDDDEATVDDLRVLIARIAECWQMGDHNVMREARTALLDVFHNSFGAPHADIQREIGRVTAPLRATSQHVVPAAMTLYNSRILR